MWKLPKFAFRESSVAAPPIGIFNFYPALISAMGKAPKREANSASSATAVLRSDVKESLKPSPIFQSFKLLESTEGAGAPGRYRVVLIEEGMGNARDAYFYTKDALKSAAPLFNGKKCFANHPTNREENERPERDVRDIVGHFEESKYEVEDGRGIVTADLVILAGASYEWVRELLTSALDFAKANPGQELVGLSINASGSSDQMTTIEGLLQRGVPKAVKPKLEEALRNGVSTVKMVNEISDANSCDLVTEAGAGGKVIEAISPKKGA